MKLSCFDLEVVFLIYVSSKYFARFSADVGKSTIIFVGLKSGRIFRSF